MLGCVERRGGEERKRGEDERRRGGEDSTRTDTAMFRPMFRRQISQINAHPMKD